MAEKAQRCTCLRGLPPRGAGYRPTEPCPRHGRRELPTPPPPPVGSGGGSPSNWETSVLAAALEMCMAHRSPMQRVLGARRPCLTCLQAAIRPHVVLPPERWQVRHVESGAVVPCRDRAEAEAHVRESVSGPWVAEIVISPGADPRGAAE